MDNQLQQPSFTSTGDDISQSRTVAQSPRMRELKVEDALLYLDQVKLEFSDKPHIYNEFLEIMKNFKAQSINTPGVIERVKNLFRGYNKLILGFNTFLPEGEGFKIELTPEEENMLPPGHTAAMHPNLMGMNGMNGQPAPGDQLGMTAPMMGGGLPPLMQHQMMHQMHMAGGQTIDGLGQPGLGPNHGLAMGGPMVMGANARPIGGAAGNGQGRVGAPPLAPSQPGLGGPQAAAMAGAQFKPPQQMQQQRAIQYVTNIRNRFANEPETYRAFLKILHTYQKEQNGIKEVLEQVSQLFADHPDLLMEFTYFLPDVVQEQAKERLHRAVRESEMRRRTMMHQQQQQQMGMVGVHGNAGIKRPRIGDRDMMAGKSAQMMGMQGVPGMPMFDPANMNQRGGGPMRGMPANMHGQQRKPRGQRKGQLQDMMPSSMQQQQQQLMHQGNGMGMHGGMLGNGMQHSGSMGREDGGKIGSALGSFQHVSATAERRFFDQVKEVMFSVSRESWSEFVKCLDLFVTGDINKKDMLELVKDLFGGSNNDLFEEFKRLLAGRDEYEANGQDLWFATPLSEVDFTQCLRCTPSYRALPKDFPRPQCSERGEMESSLLNDNWVSIPIGSEESYSFKHMRKNQFEEALFRCEDDRFEIDMIIDSNMSTIRILEPIAEEINEIVSLEASSGAGLGHNASRFNFQLEKRNLSTIHLNSISRLYGEHGQEILELLRKNPAGTIPVVLKRLKQKDAEWRKSRQQLNKHWKETLARNFEKSFDHRSFYFKQQDKKLCTARNLVEEIKGDPALLLPAAGEAPTPGATSVELGKGMTPEDFKQTRLSRTVAPELAHLLGSMTPNLVMDYSIEHQCVHRDIYKIFCHVAETTITSHVEKERLVALWRDLLRSFFNIPPHLLYNETEIRPNDARQITAADAWSAGTKVITVMGTGKIVRFRPSDKMYEVQLPFGVGFMRHSSIIGAEVLSPQALQAVGVATDPSTGADVILNGAVTSSGSQPGVQQPSNLFFGTQMCYLFIRLHHIIFSRLTTARQLAFSESQNEWKAHPLSKLDAPEDVDDEDGIKLGVVPPSRRSQTRRYSNYIGQLLTHLDGTSDSARYEDSCRQFLGNKSFVLFTLDKVILQALKCLQAMASDDSITKLVGLFVYHRSRGLLAGQGVDPELYLGHVAHTLSHTMEDVYRIQILTPRDIGPQNLNIQTSCQFLGILNSGGPANAVRAPQLVLPDAEYEEEPDLEVENNEAMIALLGEGGRGSGEEDEDEDTDAMGAGSAAMMAVDEEDEDEEGSQDMEGVRELEGLGAGVGGEMQ